MKNKIFGLLLGLVPLGLQADIMLPAIIGDHMVLQQNAKVKIWGWTTNPNEKVSIKSDWDTTTYKTEARYGKFVIDLQTPKAGGKHQLTFLSEGKPVQLNDIVFGENWLLSGQSNMEWSGSKNLKEALDEMPNANFDGLRFFYIPKTVSEFPQEDVKARWVVCNPNDMKNFSAIGYFFGKKLHQTLNIPIGLINSNWGGTPAEVWVPKEEITNNPDLFASSKKLKTYNWWSSIAGDNYNAMIHPIKNFNIAGVLWYQGESNVDNYSTYAQLMNRLILSWRSAFGKEFPFYFAQIAPYAGYAKGLGAKLREQQTQSLQTPQTAMVVLSDLVDNIKDIHPNLKKEVANRFANLALVKVYGKEAGPILYPKYDRHEIVKNKIKIYFKEVGDKLVLKNGESVSHLYIAGENRQFYPAESKLEKNAMVVWSKEVPNPVAVRYGFENDAMPNVFSKEGLPLNLFRTDNWED
jgi:sialate O-acetylesterase